jgi:hypothetical protein
VQTAKFAVTTFAHTGTAFPLTGAHQTVSCGGCHKPETGVFPAGRGAAIRLKGLARDCGGCHQDEHAGQFTAPCQTCHTTATFHLAGYQHQTRSWSAYFVGRHASAACDACHKQASGRGRGTAAAVQAVQFKIDARCTTCHMDAHRGALGSRCGDCHKP